MKVDLENNKITISAPHMDKYHMRQLSFWRFLKTPSGFSIETNDARKLLVKVINYLKKEGLDVEISQEADEAYKSSQATQSDFTEKKELLRDFKEGRFDKKSYRDFVDFLTHNLKRTLKEHQKKAAFHLYLARNGANFSVPGSGKTAVVLSVYEKLRQEGLVNTLFVVGPPASFSPWKHEFEMTLGRIPRSMILAGGNKVGRKLEYYPAEDTKSELYLTTFQTVLMDQDEVMKLFEAKHIKALLVVDEAHYIKQLDGNWSNAILKISKSATVRCVLTGTPIPRSYADVFNLFDFLWPDTPPLDSQAKHKIQLYEKNKEYAAIKPLLEDKVGSLFYRVRKADLGLSEPVFHKPFSIEMNKYERIIYDAIENKIKDKTVNDDFNDIELVWKLRRGRLIRLRQTVSYSKLLQTAVEGYSETLYGEKSDIAKYIKNYDSLEMPAKVEHLLGMLKEFKRKKEKVVIWSNFIGTIEFLSKVLTDKSFYNKFIYGKTPFENSTISEEETREKIRNEFVNPDSGLDILIANPAACAESISLHTTCHNAIYYDLSYNCAQYLQSLDRIHRVGGSEKIPSHYYFLQYADTFEDDIKRNLETKAEKMYSLIDQDYTIYNLDMFEDEDLAAYDRIFK